MKLNLIKRDGLFSKVIEALIDITLVNLGFYLAFHIRFDFQPVLLNLQPFYDIIPYISILTPIIFCFFNMFYSLRKSMLDILFNLFVSLIVVNIATAGVVFFSRGFTFPRSVFFIGFIIQFISIAIFKYIIKYILKKNYKTIKQNAY